MQHSGLFDPKTLANPEWLASGQFDSLFIEVYEMAMAPAAIHRKIFRFNEIVVAIKVARLEYLETVDTKLRFGPNRQVEASAQPKFSTSDLSAKVITVQPYSTNRPNDEHEIADRSSRYISLLISTNYKNIAFRRIFKEICGLRDNSVMVAGSMIRLPFDLPSPDLSSTSLDRFNRCHQAIHSLPEAQRRKIDLSLHWHIKGVQSDNLDSFLSLWIALETLTMRSTNIADLNSALASAYKTTAMSAATEFGTGRLFGLRSRILHAGSRRRVSSDLTDYMECLYADVLIHKLLGESVGRARHFLSSKKIDIRSLTSI